MRLLIIDDEPHIRHMMRLTLEAIGYQVDEAPDGQAGLDRFGDGREYDAVVLDQKMPGLDGIETLQRIKENAPDARVLMATAFGSIELAVDAMRLGATDFLRKPMTPETLRNAVAAAIASEVSRRPLKRGAPPPPSGPVEIAVLTMNGFQILRAPGAASLSSPEHAFRVRHVHAVELTRVHHPTGRILRERGLERRVLVVAFSGNDPNDWQGEHGRELEVALVMPWHGHDGARAVLHEHVIGNPDRDGRTRGRVRRVASGEDAGLLLGHFSRDQILALGALPIRLDLGALLVSR